MREQLGESSGITIAEIHEMNTKQQRIDYQAASDYINCYFEQHPGNISELDQLVEKLMKEGDLTRDAVVASIFRLMEDGVIHIV